MAPVHVNETPEVSYPSHAVAARFDDGRGAGEIAETLVAKGLEPDQVWVFEGDEGRNAFASRGTFFERLFRRFDELDAPFRYAIDEGAVAVIVRCISDEQAKETVAELAEAGALNASYVSNWTITE